jgi:hypothetical protein
MLRKISGPVRVEEAGDWGKLRKGKLRDYDNKQYGGGRIKEKEMSEAYFRRTGFLVGI